MTRGDVVRAFQRFGESARSAARALQDLYRPLLALREAMQPEAQYRRRYDARGRARARRLAGKKG